MPWRCHGGSAHGSCRRASRLEGGGGWRAVEAGGQWRLEGGGGWRAVEAGGQVEAGRGCTRATVRARRGRGAGLGAGLGAGMGAGGARTWATAGSALARNSKARSSSSPCRMRPAATASRTSVRASLGFASPASPPAAAASAAASASARATAASMPEPPDPPAPAACPCACPCASDALRFTSSLLRTSAARTWPARGRGLLRGGPPRFQAPRCQAQCQSRRSVSTLSRPGGPAARGPWARGAVARTLIERRRPSEQVISW